MSEFKSEVLIVVDVNGERRRCNVTVLGEADEFHVTAEGFPNYFPDASEEEQNIVSARYVDCGKPAKFDTKEKAFADVKAKALAFMERELKAD